MTYDQANRLQALVASNGYTVFWTCDCTYHKIVKITEAFDACLDDCGKHIELLNACAEDIIVAKIFKHWECL
jgi:hypothetical protein